MTIDSQSAGLAQKSSVSSVRAQVGDSVRFDWIMALLSAWVVGGMVLDGWAHLNLPSELETFFTPWHAVLYTGFLAAASFLLVTFVRNWRRGCAWQQALPAGYNTALLGVVIFGLGGMGDMLWHKIFGIEETAVEALLSPTHLAIAIGAVLIASGPLRAAWQRSGERPGLTWSSQWPAILSLSLTFTICTFMTMYAHPMMDALAARPPGRPFGAPPSSLQALGSAAIILQTGILMGFVLFAIRRWQLPPGALTLMLTLNAATIDVMRERFLFIPVALVAGAVADLLLYALRPSARRPLALRAFAFTMPSAFYALYFGALALTSGVWWTVHMWTGIILVTGIVGLLLSYLVAPPETHDKTPV